MTVFRIHTEFERQWIIRKLYYMDSTKYPLKSYLFSSVSGAESPTASEKLFFFHVGTIDPYLGFRKYRDHRHQTDDATFS